MVVSIIGEEEIRKVQKQVVISLDGSCIRCYDSPLGRLIITADDIGITEVCFGDGDDVPETDSNPHIYDAIGWLDTYFNGSEPENTVSLHMIGTDFQMSVWDELLKIPYGHTMTYGEIAERIAKMRGIEHMSAQAVGNAIGRNPVAVIVPCHRVIGKDGSMTGYAGGIDRKVGLLRIEGILSE